MLITFKSKSAGDVIMYKEHARRILELLHKDVDRGVITAAETAHAVALLEAEIAESRLHPTSSELNRDVAAHHGDEGDDSGHEAVEPVSFATRAYPLLDMLREAQKGGHDIVWGV